MKNKNILFGTVSIFISLLLLFFLPTETEGALYDDTIRLHILAPSDSEEDQALKLSLRDDLLTHYSEELLKGESKDEAEESLKALLPQIKDYLEGRVVEYGYNYKITVELSEEWYDTREYEDISLPKGRYTSLKIIIGEGEGKNWWCVMYPPLCLDLATEDAPIDDGLGKYSDGEISLIKREKKYNVKFKLLELFSSAFSQSS